VSESTAIILARAGRRFIQPRPVTLFGVPIEWVDTTCYLVVTLDTRLTWSPHIDQFRRRAAQRLGMLDPLLNRKSDLSVRNGVLLYKQLIRPMRGDPQHPPMSGRCRCCNPSVFALLLVPPGT
jgi:hypothetical protein